MQFIKSVLRIASKVIFILMVAIIVFFCINNHQVVNVSLSPLPYEIETRLFLMILFCLFGGILIGYICCSFKLTKEKFKNFLNGWKIDSLEKKVAATTMKLEEKNKEQQN